MLSHNTSNGSGLFTIPDEFTQQVPCRISPQLFDDVALEIDIEESEWVNLSSQEQASYINAKHDAEQRAIDACNRCPLLDACKEWALSTDIEVFGVVGGTTPEQRSPNSKTTVMVTEVPNRKQTKSERDALIVEMLQAGVSNKDIAQRANCSVRTVERRKAELKRDIVNPEPDESLNITSNADAILTSGKVTRINRARTVDEAVNTLIPGRVSDETAAIFDELVDGSVRSREKLLELAPSLITSEQALSVLPQDRDYGSEEEAFKAGARKFLMNRIDIAARRGRLILMKTDTNDVLVGMDSDTARVWAQYRARAAS